MTTSVYPSERQFVWRVLRIFVREQYERALFRLHILRWLTLSLGFWTALLAGYVVLDRAGLGWLGGVAIGAWLALTLPQAGLQLRLILDVARYGATGRMVFFPRFLQVLERERELWGARRPPLWAQLLAAAGITFPLSGLALWCLGVLVRAPQSACVLAPAPASPARPRASPRSCSSCSSSSSSSC